MAVFQYSIFRAAGKRKIVTGIFMYFLSFALQAQISSPGLGKGHTASWMAVGLRQQMDSANKIQSMTYLGMGRISTPDNYNLYDHSAIWVVNQEFYLRLNKHWQYSAALSYRRQNEYEKQAPYEKASPPYKNEFRAYARLIYSIPFNKFKLVFTLRQELRKFYAPDLHPWEENLQFRTRFRTQLVYTLDKNKQHVFTVSGEPLFSISHLINPNQSWSGFGYHESRFSFYYSFTPRHQHMTCSVGYMNDLTGNHYHITDVHYVALDLIFKNPFRFHQHQRP